AAAQGPCVRYALVAGAAPGAALRPRGGAPDPDGHGAVHGEGRNVRRDRGEGGRDMKTPHIAPATVHATLARHMLADGYDLVLDMEKSQGRRLHDARTGRDYLDLFSFFATLPIGFNHPKTKDPAFLACLTRAALVNPTNSDIYTTDFAEF